MIGDELLATIAAGEPNDRIWQEAIELSEYIFRYLSLALFNDVAIATFKAVSLAKHPDTFAALATCLLEHCWSTISRSLIV